MTSDKKDFIEEIFNIVSIDDENDNEVDNTTEIIIDDTEKEVVDEGADLSMIYENMDIINNLEGVIPESLLGLIRGYIDYSEDVITNRALLSLDGLNPVQRRILYAMAYIDKIDDITKCASVTGTTMKIHPHGDKAIYLALCRLIDSAEVLQIPYLEGKGAFKKINQMGKSSEARYTGCKLSKYAKEFFRGMEGINYEPSYDAKFDEPTVLPVSFPSLLCNASVGIAVGIASNIPSYNFNDVLNATIEYIKTGDIKNVLVPDFTSKGYIYNNEEEFRNIMETGRGKITLKGKWVIDGNKISITELPYYTNVKQMKDMALKIPKGISDIKILNGRNKRIDFTVICTSKKVVGEVLTELMKTTNLQMDVTTNMYLLVDGVPLKLGVKDIIREWVNFRKTILGKAKKVQLEELELRLERRRLLLSLIGDGDLLDKFLSLIRKECMEVGINYLKEILVGFSDESYEWLKGYSIPIEGLSREGIEKRQKQIEKDTDDINSLKYDIANLDDAIVRELEDLNNRYKVERKTELTDDIFIRDDSKCKIEVVPESVKVVIKDNFIRKFRNNKDLDIDFIECMSNDIISMIDTKGRLLRVDLDNIEFAKDKDKGVYLPTYLGVENDTIILIHEIVSDKKMAYVYDDGYVSVVDYKEWLDGKRCKRVTLKGVSPLARHIVGEFELSDSIGGILVETQKGSKGIASADFKIKNRTARTKFIDGLEGDDKVIGIRVLSAKEVLELSPLNDLYKGTLKN